MSTAFAQAPDLGAPTVTEAIEGWFVARAPRKDSPHTTRNYRRDLDAILEHISADLNADVDAIRVTELTLPVMQRAFGAWASTPITTRVGTRERSAASIRRCHSTWSGFFEHLVANELVDGSPMPAVARPKVPRRNPKPLREDDTSRIIAALRDASVQRRDPWPELDAAVVLTTLTTGVRAAELLGVNIGDVIRAPGSERIEVTGKGGKQRSVPIEPILLAFLTDYLHTRRTRFPHTARQRGVPDGAEEWAWWRPDSPLFVDRHGDRMQYGALKYLVTLVYRSAGVRNPQGALVHAMRHTAATRMVERGATAVQLMDFLGHASLATSQNYVTATASSVRDAAARNPVYEELTTTGTGTGTGTATTGTDTADGTAD